MAGFNFNELYTVFKAKMEKISECTVGKYVTPKPSQFPYCDVSLGDNSGGNYDLQGNEGSTKPMIVLSVYDTGSLADSICEEISNRAKEIMLSYGFKCIAGPIPVTNVTDTDIVRWIGRYQRVFGSGDELRTIN